MDLQSLNWPAVIAAAASAFLLGGIWYGPDAIPQHRLIRSS